MNKTTVSVPPGRVDSSTLAQDKAVSDNSPMGREARIDGFGTGKADQSTLAQDKAVSDNSPMGRASIEGFSGTGLMNGKI